MCKILEVLLNMVNFLFFSSAVQSLYKIGLVVEPSGAAAFAAIMARKVPDADSKRVVAFITGGNVTPEELSKLTV